MNCRTGCRTRDHDTYAACLRASAPQVLPAGRRTLSTERELHAYAEARRQGVQPEGTRMHQTNEAIRLSDTAGAPYDAGTGGYAT